MSQPDDKRKQPRIPVELWVELSCAGETYFQRATNMSRTGAWFAQTFPLPVGSTASLSFDLPDGGPKVRCGGTVVNAQDLGMGVNFTHLKEADRVRIDALVDRAAGRV
jgi:hypothetical protein